MCRLRRWLNYIVGLAVCIVLLAGCSRKTQQSIPMKDVGGMIVSVRVRPGLPQEGRAEGNAITGDNTLAITIKDDQTSAPINDANVSAYAANNLTGDQRPETGRSQSNGLYLVPIRFAVPDDYKVNVEIQRPGQRDPITTSFTITAS